MSHIPIENHHYETDDILDDQNLANMMPKFDFWLNKQILLTIFNTHTSY